MISTRSLARIGGLLYLIVAVGGAFSELYVRASVKVAGDAAATTSNIAHHGTLFRLGFITDLLDFTCFLGVGIVLYALLRSVNPQVAVAMLTINAVSVAIQALNMLNHLGALLIATDPHFTAGLNAQASQSLVLFLLEMHHQGYLIAQIFFGLYLAPLGYLVFRSGMFPKALGAVLVIGSLGYLADVVAVYLAPGFQSGVAPYFATVGGVCELLFVLWLAIVGAHDRHRADIRPAALEAA